MEKSKDKEMTPEEEAKLAVNRTAQYRAKKRKTPEGAAELRAKSQEYTRRYRLKKKMEAKLGEGQKLDKKKMGEIRKELEQEELNEKTEKKKERVFPNSTAKSAAYRARMRETPEGTEMLKERSRITSRKYRMKLKEKEEAKEVAAALLAIQGGGAATGALITLPKEKRKIPMTGAERQAAYRARKRATQGGAIQLKERSKKYNRKFRMKEGMKKEAKVLLAFQKQGMQGKVTVDPITEAKERLQEAGGKKNLPIKKRALPLAYTRRKEEVHTTITEILKGGVTDAEQAAYAALKRATPGDIIELEKTSNNEESSDRVVAIAVSDPPLAQVAGNASKMKTSRAMTGAERQAAYRARKRATKEGATERFESFYGVPPASVAAQKLEGGEQQRKVVAVDPVTEAEVKKRIQEEVKERLQEAVHTTITEILFTALQRKARNDSAATS